MIPGAAVNGKINWRGRHRLVRVDLQVAIKTPASAWTGKLQNFGCLRLILAHHGLILLDSGPWSEAGRPM
jgi:hypothetical protein